MHFFTSLAEIPPTFGPSVVTIGKFDGVHIGHREVIAQLLDAAAVSGLTPTVVTFDRHPLTLLDPAHCPEPLISNAQKRELLASLGVAALLMVTFDASFSRQTPRQFVETILVGALHARTVIVGGDFLFGSDGSGDAALLTALGGEYGVEVRTIADVRPRNARRVSSTWIRELISEGDVAAAAELLGRAPSVRSVVVHGAHRGRELGYPTANLAQEVEGLVPADGIYAAWLSADGCRYPAAASVGSNPTFDDVPRKQVEAFVLDETLDLYGHTVELSFVQRIRDMQKFAGVTELIEQIRRDEAEVRHILAVPPR